MSRDFYTVRFHSPVPEHCCKCGERFHAGIGAKPEPGMLALCAHCGMFMCLDGGLRLVAADMEQLRQLPQWKKLKRFRTQVLESMQK